MGKPYHRKPSAVFVFGSNLSGVHGAGAALYAKRFYGAVQGVGVGPTGTAYALPTKGHAPGLPCLPLETIARHAGDFAAHAAANPQLTFQLTAVGCGLAGNHPRDIAPMFRAVPSNVLLPPQWRSYLEEQPDSRFWRLGQFEAPPTPSAAVRGKSAAR